LLSGLRGAADNGYTEAAVGIQDDGMNRKYIITHIPACEHDSNDISTVTSMHIT